MNNPKRRKTFFDYVDPDEIRKGALRVYVNSGERELLKEAIRSTERIPDLSAWASRVLLKEACRILGIEYPY